MALRTGSELTLMLLVGLLGVYAAPVEINSIILHLHDDPIRAGGLSTIELLALGGVAIASGALADRAGPRQVVLGGALIAGLAQSASMAVASLAGLLALRLMAGLGAGLVYGCACRHANGCRRPSAVFGLAMLCANLLFAGILAVLPALDARFGLAGLFAALAGVTFAAWLLLAALMRPGAGRGPAEVGAGVEAGTRARAAFVLAGAGGLFLASVFLSNLGLSMVWTSASRLGVENGLSQSWIAYALALSTLANVAGAGLAAMAALLCGPRPMLLAGLAAGAVAAVLILFAARPQIYVLALCLYGAAYLFIIPFQITMAMHLSPRGHLSAITGGLGLMSYGCGPLAGGVAAAMGAYRLVGVACALLCLCAALAVVLVREPRLQPALG